MRLFAGDCREVFVYEYVEGEYVDPWSIMLYSYREITPPEFEAVRKEFEALRTAYQQSIIEINERSGINSARAVAHTKQRYSKVQMDAIYAERVTAISQLTSPPHSYYEFLRQKLDLKELEPHAQI